jgi:hypothetical protein
MPWTATHLPPRIGGLNAVPGVSTRVLHSVLQPEANLLCYTSLALPLAQALLRAALQHRSTHPRLPLRLVERKTHLCAEEEVASRQLTVR